MLFKGDLISHIPYGPANSCDDNDIEFLKTGRKGMKPSHSLLKGSRDIIFSHSRSQDPPDYLRSVTSEEEMVV
jgi:hypothetical protein